MFQPLMSETLVEMALETEDEENMLLWVSRASAPEGGGVIPPLVTTIVIL